MPFPALRRAGGRAAAGGWGAGVLGVGGERKPSRSVDLQRELLIALRRQMQRFYFLFNPPLRRRLLLLLLLLLLLSGYGNGNGREGKCNYGIIKWFHGGNYEPFNARQSLQLSAYRTRKQAKWFKH